MCKLVNGCIFIPYSVVYLYQNFKITLMNKITLLPLLALAVAGSAFAQKSRTFAITSPGQGNYYWSDIREINLQTGEVVRTVFETDKTGFTAFDATTKKALTDPAGFSANFNNKPFAYGVAACAYDKKHDRLYYTPMHTAQIRYIDLGAKEAKFFYLQDKMIDNTSGYLTEENHITRMVLTGKTGYAITNDGNHVFEFGTGKNPSVKDLGALIDDPANNGISIHNKCSSWGGDLIAANDGSLVLITANRHIFSITPGTRVAKHIGSITGIPGNYTTNGAVVNDAGKIVVTSANATSGYYQVDFATLAATKIEGAASVYSTSDMANANELDVRKPNDVVTVEEKKVNNISLVGNEHVNVYPNPASTPQFKINFDEMQKGQYIITVTDLMGRTIHNQRINVQNENQVETIDLKSKPAKGLYLVKIADVAQKDVFVGKIIFE
jgi:hypothetical protein